MAAPEGRSPQLRVALDANVLIAGTILPRWPHELLRAAVAHRFSLVLPEQVIEEARRHLTGYEQEVLDSLLDQTRFELVAMPSRREVAANLDIVRSAKDVPIALALLAAGVDILVTNDRDFTDPGAVAARFSERVRVMLPANFLREVLGWSSEALEVIRSRRWEDLRDGGKEA
jgi:predicted nucleic acid-binding protein